MQVDLPTLLLDLHRYFSSLGASEVRRLSNNNDKPLRMVKTMLHTLCKIYGYRIADIITTLPELRDLQTQPMIAMYADINLKSLAEIGMIAPRDADEAGPPTPSGAATAVPTAPPPALSSPSAAPALSSPSSAVAPGTPGAGASPAGDADVIEPQVPPLISHSSHSASGLDAAAPGHPTGAVYEPQAPGVAAVNSSMSAERTASASAASSLSSHALGLAGATSDGQQSLPTQTVALQTTRGQLSESGSAASGSFKRSVSSTAGAAAAVAAATTVANGTGSVMSGGSGGVPSSGSGSLAKSGSAGLVQSNSAMSGGANSGQLSARSTQPDTNRSGGADSDEGDPEEDDPAAHPDHFLSRIARRVESGGGEQPQPLQSSNTVNTSPGRHHTIGPTMPEDLREKVCYISPCVVLQSAHRIFNGQQQQSNTIFERSVCMAL